MKKVLLFFATVFAAGAMMAQTIVSQQPSNRNVILEEYTGVNCGWCPDGHAACNALAATYPGHFFAINIHQGSFSANTYTTQWGNALANQYSINSWPNATVNRGASASSGGSAGRPEWGNWAQTVQAQVSPVNVAAEGTINPDTRELTLHIEVYYTGNGGTTNKLNVALLQNNVIGSQAGSSMNASYVLSDGRYRHMHMLRDLITGQWGVDIPATQGTFIDTTIHYTIQQSYGTPNALKVGALSDLEVIVFVAENTKNIYTGTKANIVFTQPEISYVYVEHNSECALDFLPIVAVNNNTPNTFNGFSFMYNGQQVVSNKVLQPYTLDTVHMPLQTVNLTDDVHQYTINDTVQIYSYLYNDVWTAATSAPTVFTLCDFNYYSVEGPINVKFVLDQYSDEASIKLRKQADCSTLFTKQFTTADKNKTCNYRLSPAEAGTYIFSVYDSYGDGMASNAKGVTLSDGNNTTFWQAKGNYGKQADCWMNITNAGTGAMGINDVVENVNFNVYPNPVFDRLNIECGAAVREVNVIDMTGRTVITSNTANNINVSGLATGVYMVRVATENGVGMQKFVKE